MANKMATETLLKGQLYQKIKDLLTGAGWQNISSKPDTDFDVFYSTGEAGDKTLYLQLRDYYHSAATNTGWFQYRFCGVYTPGQPGALGTFDSLRAGEPWRNAHFFNNTVNIDVPITFSYQVNKDRLVFFADPPLGMISGNIRGNIVFLGARQLFEAEPKCRGLVFAAATYDGTNIGAHNYVVSYGVPYTDSNAQSEALFSYKITPSFEYNAADSRMMSEIAYGNGIEGLRGKLDGFYALYGGNSRTGHGDILSDGTHTYKVVQIANIACLLFPDTAMYAFQIS
jgi:hypothetical protein